MDHTRKTWVAAFGLLLLCSTVEAQSNGLGWKMAFLKDAKGKVESLPFSRPLTLADGDEFQLLISPSQAAFVDVLYEDTAGEVTVLFSSVIKAGQVVLLPAEKQNFRVSPPRGTEKLHVLVATKAPVALEALFKGLPQNSRAVLDELARLKTALLSMAEAPEKPVPMGGVSRGLPDVKISEFKGAESYAKTIRFDH